MAALFGAVNNRPVQQAAATAPTIVESWPDPTANLMRAESVVQTVVPVDGGEPTNELSASWWIRVFAAEATDAELPIAYWPRAAVGRFPAESCAALWALSVFGEGTDFVATWDEFRQAFLLQYTPANALEKAQRAFNALPMATFGIDVLSFNKEINLPAVRYSHALRDAGRPQLGQTDVFCTYSIKLAGPVKVHLEAVIRIRNSTNVERVHAGRDLFDFTLQQAFAQTESFAIHNQLGLTVAVPLSNLPPIPTTSTTTLMDLNVLQSEFAAIRTEVTRG